MPHKKKDSDHLEDKTRGQLSDFEALMKIKIPISPNNTVLPILTPEGLYNKENLVRRKRETPKLATSPTNPTINPTLINDPSNEQLMNLIYKIHERIYKADVDQNQEVNLDTASKITDLYILWKQSPDYLDYPNFYEWIHRASTKVLKSITDLKGRPLETQAPTTPSPPLAQVTSQKHRLKQH